MLPGWIKRSPSIKCVSKYGVCVSKEGTLYTASGSKSDVFLMF